MGLHQIIKLLHVKGSSYQNETSTEREKNLCQLFVYEGLISRIYKELIKLNTKRTNNPTSRLTNELKDSSQKKNKCPINP
jgi:hypothetical protein